MGRLWINPFHLVIPLILLAISMPLAIFAVITTIIAMTTLCFRVIVVYSDLVVGLITKWLFSTTKAVVSMPMGAMEEQFLHRVELAKKKLANPSRKSSSSSSPVDPPTALRKAARSDSYASLLGIGIPKRDYEGVGGWRLGRTFMMPGGDEGDSDDAKWTNFNNRLELPVGMPMLVSGGPSGSATNGKRHKRSLTGSSGRPKMSPVTNRTPMAITQAQDTEDLGYFAANPAGRSAVSRPRSMSMLMSGILSGNGRKSKRSSVESFRSDLSGPKHNGYER
jgi:hypothetical protein